MYDKLKLIINEDLWCAVFLLSLELYLVLKLRD